MPDDRRGSARRRGRPPRTDSGDTRRSIIDAARTAFAADGFDGTSLQAIAAQAELSPTALYHYVDGKEALYEAVVTETVELVYAGLLDRVSAEARLVDQIEAYLSGADEYGADERQLSAFLIGVPVQARRRPAFQPSADLLGEWQTKVFDHMAATGLATGELRCFDDVTDASQALRLLLIGWSFETHHQPRVRQVRADAVRRAVHAWTASP